VKTWFGIIPDYQCFVDDIISLTDYARELAPDTPVALYGHSMGGNIVINTVLQSSVQDTSPYICAVLESPWLGLHKPLGGLEVFFMKLLSRIMPNLRQKRTLNHAELSGDAERTAGYANDPLYHGYISMRMAAGILDGCDYAMKNAGTITVPTYLAYAENDVIVCNKAIREFAEKAGDKITIKGYESNHAVHNDKMRESFFSDVNEYIDSKL